MYWIYRVYRWILSYCQAKALGQSDCSSHLIGLSERSVDMFPVTADRSDPLPVLPGSHRVVEQLSGVEPTSSPRWAWEGLYGAYSASGEYLRGATGSLESLDQGQRAFPEGSTEGCEFPLSSAFVRSTSFLYVVPGVVPLAGVTGGLVVSPPAGAQPGDSVSHAPVGVCGALKAPDDSVYRSTSSQPTSPTGGHL
jgi:hypothetical protein